MFEETDSHTKPASLRFRNASGVPLPVTIETIKTVLGATVLAGEDLLQTEVSHIYASDLMSDVLAFGKSDSILLTGLASQQAVISAHMAEFKAVVLIRGKKMKDGAEIFARDHHIVLLSTDLDMFETCAMIAERLSGVVHTRDAEYHHPAHETIILNNRFDIEGSDFAKAGMVSTDVKSILKKIGINPAIVRRVAISLYECEMNVIMHAKRAIVDLVLTPQHIELTIDDEGKGIPDVEMAMQEGFTTSTEEQRAMGFGSGMGLPNIKRNTDELVVTSEVGKGTLVRMRFDI
jgi:anti-sigma regulatory factor (Ser/Thr protein kinase)